MAETPPYSPEPSVPDRRRPRVWIMMVAVIWALVLAGSIAWAVSSAEPTAREQTTVAEALPVVDRATANVVAAATVDGLAVVAISAAEEAGECSITVIRGGVRYQRTVLAMVAPGTERALLERMRTRLPTSYAVSLRTGAVPRLVVDAGFFVRVNGAVLAPGQVRFVIDTGDCRPPGDLSALAREPAGAEATAGTPERGAVETALAGLGLAPERWTRVQLPCATGAGAATTVEAISLEKTTPPALDAAVRPPTGSEVVAASPEAVAYRADGIGIAARVSGDRVVVTGTTLCR